jgi:hypothetical protein
MTRKSSKIKDWQHLIDLTRGEAFLVERVRLPQRDIAIEGAFEPPELGRLPPDDQIFVIAFVRAHGSIKEMERIFGVSYPTIKSRLNRISDRLDFVETDPAPSRSEILESLQRGEISADEAVRLLEALQ